MSTTYAISANQSATTREMMKRSNHEEVIIASFEAYRSYLFAIAYRMLGSVMDAEDMVQETYLRYQTAAPEAIRSLKAFLTTIIIRLCMAQLQLAHKKREQYLGPWLPEPLLTPEALTTMNPEERVDKDETISLVFLVLLEQLQPFERAVFLLREVFDYEYAEIAAFLDKSEAACRKSFNRAKKHLADHRPRYQPSPKIHQQLLASFVQAVQAGEMTALMDMLAEDVALWADGGGKVRGAATRPVRGRDLWHDLVSGPPGDFYRRTTVLRWLKSMVNRRRSFASTSKHYSS